MALNIDVLEQLLEGRRNKLPPPPPEPSYKKPWTANLDAKGQPKMDWGPWVAKGNEPPQRVVDPASRASARTAVKPRHSVKGDRGVVVNVFKQGSIADAFKGTDIDVANKSDLDRSFFLAAGDEIYRKLQSVYSKWRPTPRHSKTKKGVTAVLDRPIEPRNASEAKLSPAKLSLEQWRDTSGKIQVSNQNKNVYLVTLQQQSLDTDRARFEVNSVDVTFNAYIQSLRVTISQDGTQITAEPFEVKAYPAKALPRKRAAMVDVSKRSRERRNDTALKMMQCADKYASELIDMETFQWVDYAMEDLQKLLDTATKAKTRGKPHYYEKPAQRVGSSMHPPEVIDVADYIRGLIREKMKEFQKLQDDRARVNQRAEREKEAHKELANYKKQTFGVSDVSEVADRWPRNMGAVFSLNQKSQGADADDDRAFSALVTYKSKEIKADTEEELSKLVTTAYRGFERRLDNDRYRHLVVRNNWEMPVGGLRVVGPQNVAHMGSNPVDVSYEVRKNGKEVHLRYGKKPEPSVVVVVRAMNNGRLSAVIVPYVTLDPRLGESDDTDSESMSEEQIAAGALMLEQAQRGHMHSPQVVRQVASIVTNGAKGAAWKFSKEFLADPVNELTLAFGTAQTPGRGMTGDPKKPTDVWKLRLSQYEKALEIARKARHSETKRSKGARLNRKKKALADTQAA